MDDAPQKPIDDPGRDDARPERPPGAPQPSQWPLREAGGGGAPSPAVLRELRERFPDVPLTEQVTADGIPTAWVPPEDALEVLALPRARRRRAVRDALRPRRRRRARAAPPRGPARRRLQRLLPPRLLRAERRRAPQGGAAGGVPAGRLGGRRMARRRLVRARALGHVRRRRRRPPAPPPAPHAAVVGRAPAAQGTPVPRHRVRPVRPARPAGRRLAGGAPLQTRGVGPAGHRGRPHAHVPQHRPAARSHARAVPRRRRPARRGDRPSRPRHRLPPPRLGEDGRAPELAHLHPVHRPRGLPRRRDQQPALRALGGEALRHRGAGQGAAHPHPALRVLPHRQPPRLLRHLRPGHRRAVPGLLHVRGPGDPLRRRHRAHHRRAHAPQLVPHRRRGRGPARGLEAARAGLLRLPSAAPGRVRQAGHGQPHRQGADGRGRRRSRWTRPWPGG